MREGDESPVLGLWGQGGVSVVVVDHLVVRQVSGKSGGGGCGSGGDSGGDGGDSGGSGGDSGGIAGDSGGDCGDSGTVVVVD